MFGAYQLGGRGHITMLVPTLGRRRQDNGMVMSVVAASVGSLSLCAHLQTWMLRMGADIGRRVSWQPAHRVASPPLRFTVSAFITFPSLQIHFLTETTKSLWQCSCCQAWSELLSGKADSGANHLLLGQASRRLPCHPHPPPPPHPPSEGPAQDQALTDRKPAQN